MIYLDHGATSLGKPAAVGKAVNWAMTHCGNPGRGGHRASMLAAETVYSCREQAARLFACKPEQVVFTHNCTHGLNLAIHSLIKPGSRVVISGFEHNAAVRPLYARQAELVIAGRRLFDWEDTLEQFENALKKGVSAAVFTHCSNVFGYILPVQQLAQMCRRYAVPFVIDAAQSAGSLPVSLEALGADFIAMPGHKGLLGPEGTGLLLCARQAEPLLQGGTGSGSKSMQMPDALPERLEAGTLNVPGIAGLGAALGWLNTAGTRRIFAKEQQLASYCAAGLKNLGYRVFCGENQSGTVSFVGKTDCIAIEEKLGKRGIAVRAGLHCAPLAHQSAGTIDSGTVRVSFGWDSTKQQAEKLLQALGRER